MLSELLRLENWNEDLKSFQWNFIISNTICPVVYFDACFSD